MKYLLFFLFFLFVIITFSYGEELLNFQERRKMELVKKVTDKDRYLNCSSSPSAIKIIFQDEESGKIINAVMRSDDLLNFLKKEKRITIQNYIEFMLKHENTAILVNLRNLEYMLGKRWLGNNARGEEYIRKYTIFKQPNTFEELNVKNEQELLNKYFDFDYTKGSGKLKRQYFKEYTRNPSFIALLIDLGYDVVWGDFNPDLYIYTIPFVSLHKR